MVDYRDADRQRGIAPIVKLLAWASGGAAPTVADFDAVTPAFTLEVSGIETNVNINEYSQTDGEGREYFWPGNATASFTGQILEKTPEICLLVTGRDPADVTTAGGYNYADIDGVQATKYWKALIYGDFGDEVFGFIAEKCHFMAEGLPSIKLDSAPASFTIKIDAVDGRASLRAISGDGVV